MQGLPAAGGLTPPFLCVGGENLSPYSRSPRGCPRFGNRGGGVTAAFFPSGKVFSRKTGDAVQNRSPGKIFQTGGSLGEARRACVQLRTGAGLRLRRLTRCGQRRFFVFPAVFTCRFQLLPSPQAAPLGGVLPLLCRTAVLVPAFYHTRHHSSITWRPFPLFSL